WAGANGGPAPSAEIATSPEPAGPQPASQTAPAESKWDEIWRPRRQGRQSDRTRRRHAPPAGQGQGQVEARPPPRGKEGWGNRQRKHGPPARREDRPRPFSQSAGPPPKSGIDPDSPFAALSSLKAALERQNQE